MGNGVSGFPRHFLPLLFFLFIALGAAAQNTPVTGRVLTKDDNKPLSGVSVQVKNRAGGTTTNALGLFTIGASPGDTLVFSYVSFQTEELRVTTAEAGDILMIPEVGSLQDVVVVG